MLYEQEKQLPVLGFSIPYLQLGCGKSLIIAFPGFGSSPLQFEPLVPLLGNNYTLLSFFLPHHHPDFTQNINTAVVDATIVAAMAEYKAEKCLLLGNSIGAKLCLAALIPHHKAIEKVILIAPDGLTINKYYSFFTGNTLGSSLLEWALHTPNTSLNMLKMLNSMGMIDNSRHSLVAHFLKSRNRRLRVQYGWHALSTLHIDYNALFSLLSHEPLPIHLIVGQHDTIIPSKNAYTFASKINNATVHTLNKGHQLLDSETYRLIANIILQNS